MRLIVAIVITIITAAYMLPFAIALARGTKNLPAIFLVNFFFGWTFIGWVVSLIWSVTEKEG